MNIKNFNKLKQVSKNLSILYIESDLNVQHKISSYLNKLFKHIYQAHDGLEGFIKYKKFKPDIILTDSVLSKKNTVEMIIDIKDIEEKTPIVVLGYRSDEFLLLESLDILNLKLIEKPLDFDKLNSAFLDLVPKKINNIMNRKCFLDLKKYLNQPIPFINNYKGILLQNNEKILMVNEGSFLVKVSNIQLLSIKHQKFTIIQCGDKYIMAYLVNINHNNVLELSNPQYIQYHSRDENNKRISVDKSFKTGMFYNKEHLELLALDVSFISISMYCENNNIQFEKNSSIDLTLGFELNGLGSLVHDKKFTKIFTTAKIIRIEPFRKGNKIVALLEVKKAGINTFTKYLSQRELAIVKEIKDKIK